MRAVRSLLLLFPSVIACAPSQQIARLGDVRLESGSVIRDCRIGYRTAGQLDAARSNAVLVTPWFQGTSAELTRQIGPGKLVDSSKYFVIMVDTLGNGVSSSPSTSSLQPGDDFPTFSIGDMVETQHHLVTQVLHVAHLKAVVGISMGGMQVFQWITTYPEFMDKGISIVGSPQAQPDDRLRCQDLIRTVQANPAWKRAMFALGRGQPRAAFGELGIDAGDHARQAQAIMALDIPSSFGGSMARAASSIRARLLVVGTTKDREVNPAPGFELAGLAGAEVFHLKGDCGHQSPSCEKDTLWPLVGRFLDQ